MATLSESLVSSSARRLPLRKRPDLSAKQQRYQGRSYWIVKEPVGLNYFRFQEEEYAILEWLDGTHSLEDIKEMFEAEFPPEKITVEELQQFIGMLHRSGLIIADVPGQGHQLRKRRDERKKKELIGAFTNVLAIRFKGFDPDRFLTWLYPKVRLLFSKAFVVGSLVFALSALFLVLVQFEDFQSRLPSFHSFFNLKNAFWLAVVLGLTKVLHELGHGMTCKHFGGECHEIGVLVLVLTPCLYCNVSDSWMLPNKWHRAGIGAAGMWVEMVIAAICTYVWWFSEPGMLNYLCLSTMFVCSVSTIIFNGNPLLRYDGYYILSDVTEIPNLRQKASSILSRTLAWWCLGIEMPEDPFLPQRNQIFFALYTVASIIYRWFVVFSILFFLNKVFEPYGLKVIGQLIGMVALYGLFVHPIWKLYKFLSVPGRLAKVKKVRVLATVAVVGVVILAVALIPLPHRVLTSVVIEPDDAEPVYVLVPGRLEELDVTAGQRVKADQQLARLSNAELEVEILRLQGQLAESAERLETLRRRSFADPTLPALIPSLQQNVEAMAELIRQKKKDQLRLVLTSPIDGTVMPPPEIPDRTSQDDDILPTWAGTPLQKRNEGCYLEQRVKFCSVGDPTKWIAHLVIDQSDRNFIKEGQRVEILLDEHPLDPYEGTIADVSIREIEYTPRNLSSKAGGVVASETDASGLERPTTTSYEASVELVFPEGLMMEGLTGQAKIHAGTMTLGERLMRFLNETFNFRM